MKMSLQNMDISEICDYRAQFRDKDPLNWGGLQFLVARMKNGSFLDATSEKKMGLTARRAIPWIHFEPVTKVLGPTV
jgi:hypothetical protein